MPGELTAGIIGGLIGGAFGVVATTIGSYLGPKKLEQWRAQRRDEPRKRMLRKLLNDPAYLEGRYLDTLCLYTGTSQDECRGLLIEIEARGIRLQKGEGWVLISKKPFDQQ